MPQFDFTTYPSQIFWFAICFISLYFFLSKVILPRIKDIIANRNSLVEADLLKARDLESEIAEISRKSHDMIKDAEVNYRKSIEESVKAANVIKEESLQKFKDGSEKMLEKSNKKIDELVAASKEKSAKAAVELTNLIEKKIFN
jgi:F-type H+-transporting ATPase subunit b